MDAIYQCLLARPGGATLDDISSALPAPPDNRTLQRWMVILIDSGNARVEGSGTASRYYAVTVDASETGPAAVDTIPVGVSTAQPTAVQTQPTVTTVLMPIVVRMVVQGMPRNLAKQQLQAAATFEMKGPADMKAYVEHALAQLDSFTAADADAYGIAPEQFARWQQNYHRDTSTIQPVVAPSVAVPVTPAVPSTLAQPGNPPSGTVSSEPAPTTPSEALADSTAKAVAAERFDLSSPDALLQVLRHGRSDVLKKRAFAVIKALLTVNRIGIALAIAIVIRFMALELREINSFLPLLAYPAAGVPWVYYRWLDETEEKPLTGREAIVVLLAGGVVSVFVAGGLVSMIYMLRNAAV